jgi:transposase
VNHVAIDLGSRESQVCIRQSDGTILEEARHLTRKLETLFRRLEPSRIVVETSAEAFRVADAARLCGHEVRVVPATLVKTLGVGSRGVKNDEKDARVLSEVSCRIDLPSVHIPSTTARELRSLCGSRELLVQVRTKLVNNVRGWARTQLWRYRSGAAGTLPKRLRAHATSVDQELPEHVERMLRTIEEVTVQIKLADTQVRQLAQQDPVCQRLMTVPGVGPVTAVRFVAAIDRIDRFSSAHDLESYLGLTPGENSSADRQRTTRITKAGSSAVRWLLVEAAWNALRFYPNEPMVRWAIQVAARRGRNIGAVALARKIAGVLFALWRDGTTYRSAASSEPTG